MAQEKKVDLECGEGPRVAAYAYGDIGEDHAVLLLLGKASNSYPSGAAGYYYPLAAARLQDMPDELRRQLIQGGQLVAVALSGESPEVRYLLVDRAVPEVLRRQLAGDEVPAPMYRTGRLAVGYNGYAESVFSLKEEEDGKPASYRLDMTPLPQVPPEIIMVDELILNGFPASVEVTGVLRLDAARVPATPFADEEAQFRNKGAGGGGLRLFASEDAVPFVGRLPGADEQHSDGRPIPYAVQVLVDPAVAGDPPAVGYGTKGAGGGGGHNLSAVVVVIAASSAVTAVAGAVSPAVAFGFFMVLLGGVILAMAGVRTP